MATPPRSGFGRFSFTEIMLFAIALVLWLIWLWGIDVL
jgi:hypothetical protein